MSDFSAQLAEVVERFTHDATDVDRADAIPREHFDQIAALGLYGAFAPIAWADSNSVSLNCVTA